MERTILLKDLKNFARYRSENNFVGILKIISNAAKNYDILVWAFYIIILIVQQNYFCVLKF